jgi:hypothetical protein
MFFTKIGRIVAWIGFIGGTLRISMGILVAQFTAPDPVTAARRYLGTQTTGEAIDQGLIVLVIAIGLGILTEISRSAAVASKTGE